MLLSQFLNRPNYGSSGLLAQSPMQAGRIPGVTDELWQRLLRRESGARQIDAAGNPIMSPKGATGIAQVMPATAKEVAAQLGEPYSDERLRTDAAFNERIGKTYLNNMLDRFGGNQTLALAGYNAGPGNVDKWLKSIGDPRTGQISDASFAQAIPYQETRDYVAGLLPDLGQSPGAMGGRVQPRSPVDPSVGLLPPAAAPSQASALPDGAGEPPADQSIAEPQAVAATPRGILDILGVNGQASTPVSRETDTGLLGLGINRGATGDVLAALSQALIGAGSGDFAGGASAGLKMAQQRREGRRQEALQAAADQRQSMQDQLARLKLGMDYQTLQDEQTAKAEEKANLEKALLGLTEEERVIAQLDPKGFAAAKAKGMFGEPAQTDKLKNLHALGIDPNSAEGRAYILGSDDGNTGPYSGKSLDAQQRNILLTGDPTSPEYADAYTTLAQPKVVATGVRQDGTPIYSTITPDMRAFRLPTFGGLGGGQAPAQNVPPPIPPVLPRGGAPRAGGAGRQSPAPPVGQFGTGSPPRDTMPLPGQPTIQTIGDQAGLGAAQAKDLAAVKSGMESIQGELGAYRDAIKNAGTADFLDAASVGVTPGGANLRSLWVNSGLLAKGEELFGLGVITGPDLDLIRQAIPDPSDPKTALMSKEAILKVIDNVDAMLNRKVSAKLRSLGIEAPPAVQRRTTPDDTVTGGGGAYRNGYGLE